MDALKLNTIMQCPTDIGECPPRMLKAMFVECPKICRSTAADETPNGRVLSPPMSPQISPKTNVCAPIMEVFMYMSDKFCIHAHQAGTYRTE